MFNGEMTDSTDTPAVHSEDVRADDFSKSSSGQSRRGKQYKCGSCQGLGHNTKTCPQRLHAPDVALSTAENQRVPPEISSQPVVSVVIPVSSGIGATGSALLDNVTRQPAAAQTGAADRLLSSLRVVPVQTSLGNPELIPSESRPPHERIEPLPLDTALGAARQTVLDAEERVAKASTAEEYERAARALDESVIGLEKVVLYAHRSATAASMYNDV